MRTLPPVLAVIGVIVLACGPLAPGDGSREAERLRAELAECQEALAAVGSSVPSSTAAAAEPAPVEELSPCDAIELDPAHDAAFTIVKSEFGGWSECNLVVEAKRPIPRISFDWVFYDSDGVRLGDRIEIIKDLETGDKAKLEIRMDDATARIVSKPG